MTITLYEQQKVQKALLFLMIIFLPFSNFPVRYTTSAVGENLAFYPLLLGLILWGYECLQQKKIDIQIPYIKYFFLYVLWQEICTIIGLWQYPYDDLLNAGMNDKFVSSVQMLFSYYLNVNQSFSICLGLLLRFTVSIVRNDILIFGCVLWIFHLYKGNWEKGFGDIRRVFFVLTGLLCLYSVIELFYLRGNSIAAVVLSSINPFFYDVGVGHGWWPPLLWKGQLRSLFAEPSFFGIVAAVITPLLYSYLFETKKIVKYIIYTFFVSMIFLTKARTATCLFLGEMALLVVFILASYRKYVREVGIIVFCSIIAFLFSLAVLYNGVLGSKVLEQSGIYMSENVTSVTGNQRSNESRKGNVIAAVKVGFDHPLFGVGYGLKDGYIEKKFTKEDLDNHEIQGWVQEIHKYGILRMHIPTSNKLAVELVQFGILGCLLYLFPFLYIFYKMFKNKWVFKDIRILSLFIAFTGSVVAFLSNVEFFSLYIVMGLLLCVVDGQHIN